MRTARNNSRSIAWNFPRNFKCVLKVFMSLRYHLHPSASHTKQRLLCQLRECFFMGHCSVVATKVICCFSGLPRDAVAYPGIKGTFPAATDWQNTAHFLQFLLVNPNEAVRRGKSAVCGHSLCMASKHQNSSPAMFLLKYGRWTI